MRTTVVVSRALESAASQINFYRHEHVKSLTGKAVLIYAETRVSSNESIRGKLSAVVSVNKPGLVKSL